MKYFKFEHQKRDILQAIVKNRRLRSEVRGQIWRVSHLTSDFRHQTITALLILVFALFGMAAPPTWSVNPNEFLNTMTMIVKVADECVQSNHPNDMVGAFDVGGQVRGVATTSVAGNLAFLTVYSNGGGEDIFFKVYDAGLDAVYTVHTQSEAFVADASIGGILTPYILNFDSQPSANGSAGPDQEIFNQTSTTLSAIGAGMWRIENGVGGSLSDASNPNSTFSGLIDSCYLLAWTLSDADGCIGESDEMVVCFVIPEVENFVRTCSDGMDNDGDGLTDCADPDCGKPSITNINLTHPTSTSCTLSNADGVIELVQTGGDMFSFDGGGTYVPGMVQGGLVDGIYGVISRNTSTTCETMMSPELLNPLALKTQTTPVQLDCVERPDTVLAVTITFGNAPYVIEWKDAGNVVIPAGQRVEDGTYNVRVTDINNCESLNSVFIGRDADPLDVTPDKFLTGPGSVCQNLNGVRYDLLTPSIVGDAVWSYDGADVTITEEQGGLIGLANYGPAATAGYLKSVITNACSSKQDSMMIQFSFTNNCRFGDCDETVVVQKTFLESVQYPEIYKAKTSMTVNAGNVMRMMQFSAGQDIEFKPDFVMFAGHEMLAEIRSCD